MKGHRCVLLVCYTVHLHGLLMLLRNAVRSNGPWHGRLYTHMHAHVTCTCHMYMYMYMYMNMYVHV